MKFSKLYWGLSLAILLPIAGCGFNIASYLVNKDSEKYQLEQARTLMDQGEYGDALDILSDMDADSNERRLLLAAARLGDASLDIWSIIKELFDNTESGGQGVDNFFNSIGDSVVGTGNARVRSFSALRQSLQDLANPPQGQTAKTRGLACFIAGIWTVPLGTDAATTMQDVQSALTEVQNTTVGIECDQNALDNLDSNLADASTIASDFALIAGAVADCPFINAEASSGANSAEDQLNKVLTNADGGCESPGDCAPSDLACQALQLSCVGQILNSDATADDGLITSCELVQGCYGGGCF